MRPVFAVITAAAALEAQTSKSNPATGQINSVVSAVSHALNHRNSADLATLFASDGDLRIGGSILTGPKVIAERLGTQPVWSEVTAPRIETESLRLLSNDVAVVDARWVQYGSMIVKRAQPVVLLLRIEGGRWRVASLRLAPSCAGDGP
jgi:hypothetical protein